MKDRLGTLGQQKGQLSDKEFYRQFLMGKEWPEETEEDRFLDQMFREEMDEDVKREEALQAAHPELADAEPSPDLFDRILQRAAELDGVKTEKETVDVETDRTEEMGEAPKPSRHLRQPEELKQAMGVKYEDQKIAEYRPEEFLNEEDRKALEIGRKRMKNQRKHRWAMRLLANAAVLACVFFVGVSTEANRTRIVNVINTWIGKEALGKLNNEADRENVQNDQEKACAEIEEKLGIKPVHFMYELKGMEFDGYVIDLKTKRADLYYTYDNTILTIMMYKEENGTAKGNIKDGDANASVEIPSKIGAVKVVEIDGSTNKKYMAEFIYDNTYYHIIGEIPEDEFMNLISSIFF
ncbi:DUF4367 domain-containing protein [Lachnospiraceae bacterium OF09-6]|nr:DUF4367 domain-containing protein [Lachnospiraceae bacterium OF09-6]